MILGAVGGRPSISDLDTLSLSSSCYLSQQWKGAMASTLQNHLSTKKPSSFHQLSALAVISGADNNAFLPASEANCNVSATIILISELGMS